MFQACFDSRYFVIINLLFLPWIRSHLGQSAGITFFFGILLTVAVLRALGETAYYPWTQEFIPNSIRGIYGTVNTVLSTITSAVALFIAGRVIASGTGLDRYLGLIGVGTLLGLLGITVMKWAPGGAPDPWGGAPAAHFANMAPRRWATRTWPPTCGGWVG